jgi:hypothetical protein
MSLLSDSPAERQQDAEAEAEADLPIAGYDELTVAQVVPRLSGLSDPQMRRLHEYERRHGNRKPVLDAIERILG